MILRPLYRGQDLPTSLAVDMTAAGSGSSGITVPDNSNINFVTGNFSIHWEAALPDWSIASSGADLWFKYQNADNRVAARLQSTGEMRLLARAGAVTIIDELSAASVETILAPNQNAMLTYVCARETASTAGAVEFYINSQIFNTQTIPAAATVSISNTGQGNISCAGTTGDARLASTTRTLRLFNRALSAADVLALRTTGAVNAADVGATQTPIYSSDFSVGADGWTGTNYTVVGNIDGILGVDNVLRSTCSSTGTARRINKTVGINLGKRYSIEISVYFPVANVSADSFIITNQSGTILATGLLQTNVAKGAWASFYYEFIAAVEATGIRIYTGTTGSTSASTTLNDIMYMGVFNLKRIGCILNLEPTGIAADNLTWTDSSGNGNDGTLPASGASKVTLRK